MKKLIVANWKANKTVKEASEWVEVVKDKLESLENVQIVICGSFIVLPILENLLIESNLKVGAQNVSQFPEGAYTGEVTADMLSGLSSYSLVGHSERKKYFGETEETVIKKIELLFAKSITPVLCVADLEQLESYLSKSPLIKENSEKIVFVYEPPSAISGGGDFHPETPEAAEKVCEEFAAKIGQNSTVLYGGSVNVENIKGFLVRRSIDGVLPGQSSLDPDTFLKLASSANEAVV